MKLDEEKIVEYLRNNMRGYITSYQLVDKTGACDTDLKKLSMEELFKLDEEVFEIGKRNNYLLSKRHHYFEELGMPWNIDFEIIYNDCDYFEDTFGYGSYVRCRGEAMIASDLLKQDEGIYGLIFDLSPDSDGSVK